MTVQKDDIQVRLAELVKTKRSEIRLKHSIAADRELNIAVPKLEKAFHKAVAKGELP